MKYTRFEFKGNNKIDFKKVLFGFFIIVPVTGLLLGMFIYKLLLLPHVFKIDNPVSIQNNPWTYEDIKPRKYFVVQMGAFSSQDNASALVNRINTFGMPAFAYRADQYSRVIVHISTEQEPAGKKIRDYKSMGYSCLVRELIISGKKVPESLMTDDRYIIMNKLVNSAGAAVDEYIELLLQWEKGDMDYETLEGKIQDACERMYNIVKGYDIPQVHGDPIIDEVSKRTETIVQLPWRENSADESVSKTIGYCERIIESAYLFYDLINYYNDHAVTIYQSGGDLLDKGESS